MAKTTKRARKFSAKGGAKAMLQKGTITRRGKLKTSKRQSNKGAKDPDAQAAMEEADRIRLKEADVKKRAEKDFIGDAKTLGELDIESFFEKAIGGDEDEDEESTSGDKEDADMDEDSDDDEDSEGENSEESESVGSEDEDMEDTEAQMKMELEKLEQTDPEFHKYLEENEKSLLEYGDDDIADEDDDDIADEDDKVDDVDDEARPEKKKPKSKAHDSNGSILTPKLLKSMEQAAFSSHSTKGLKRIISAYTTACHLSDASRQGEDDSPAPGKRSFHIESPAVFDRLMAVCLRRCHEEFFYHLLGEGSGMQESKLTENDSGSENDDDESKSNDNSSDENKPLNPKNLTKSQRWIDINPLLHSFLKASIHVLSEATEANLLKFVLQSLAKYVPYMPAYPRVARALLKTCNKLWSASLDSSEDYQVVRLNAFLRIRQLAITQPYPFIEDCLKVTYLAYAKRSKFGTASSVTSLLPTLTFMGNCVVELYNLDYASSYQYAFVYIRQLALHLRAALQKKTPEAMQVVYCWQFIHCLKCWVAVLSASSGMASKSTGTGGKDDEAQLLRSLIFPLTEIIAGVVRLIPTAKYLPLRLHCVRLLQQLAASSETFIPTTSILLAVFDLKEVYMKPKRVESRGGAVRGVRLPLILKLPNEGTLRTVEQLEACLNEVFVLLNREVDLYRFSPGFPEFTFQILQRLRKFNKEVKNGRWRAYSKGCIELCEKHSATAVKGRSMLTEAPKDIKRLEALKPTNLPSMRERFEVAVAKEKRLEAASQPAAKTKGKQEPKEEAEKTETGDAKQTGKPKKKKDVKSFVNEADLKNVAALEEDDEVQEGVVWSDSESD